MLLLGNESPYEDLKFTIYRANFTETSGNFNFYNPELNTGTRYQSSNYLLPNPLEFSSKKISKLANWEKQLFKIVD
jgi:hypothetical protein